MTTRSNTNIYLIGYTNDTITGARLPSQKQTLQLLFHYLKSEKKTLRESCHVTIAKVAEFWRKANLPTTNMQHSIERLERIYNEWRKLQKNQKRGGYGQKEKEKLFVESIEKTFNISHANSDYLIPNKEDKLFLEMQLGDGRQSSSMAQVDKKFQEKRQRTQARMDAMKARAKREKLPTNTIKVSSLSNEFISTDDENENDGDNSESSDEYIPSVKRRPRNLITPQVASALDRTKISDRSAVFTLASVSQSLGHDPTEFALNRWSIRRSRIANRQEVAALGKEVVSSHTFLVVHWDGKLMGDIAMKYTKVERLPIIISGPTAERILHVPKLVNGTGKAIAEAVFSTLQEWNVADKIKAMSFDTTASNSGIRSGAAVLIEEKLNRHLLHLPCRHHIMEIVLRDVFTALMGPSKSPEVDVFKRFQTGWPNLDHHKIDNGMDDHETAEVFSRHGELVTSVIEFAADCLQKKDTQTRDDYRELLELSIIYMGAVPPRGFHILAPGAMHRARWMSKAIYSLKIFIFKSQFRLTAEEIISLRSFNLFICLVYLKSWYTAPTPIHAPLNDLLLLKQIIQYKTINELVSKAAFNAMSRHTWYLNEELVAFSFFDERIDAVMKCKMIQALKTRDGTGNRRTRAHVDESRMVFPEIADFVNKNTKHFFEILGTSTCWLEKEPLTWEEDSNYTTTRSMVSTLAVVNDRAERGVALMQEYNHLLTKDETQKQALLHVVSEHRKNYPNANKSTVTNA
jgi:hypothetical protein